MIVQGENKKKIGVFVLFSIRFRTYSKGKSPLEFKTKTEIQGINKKKNKFNKLTKFPEFKEKRLQSKK